MIILRNQSSKQQLKHLPIPSATALDGFFMRTTALLREMISRLGRKRDISDPRTTPRPCGQQMVRSTTPRTAQIQPVLLALTVEAATPALEPVVPRALQLHGVVPNPFNPQTRIRFALPHAGAVSLKVHDVKGRLVRTLVAGNRAAGEHLVRWDGRDLGGRSVASGTYYARLMFGGESRVQAMSLVR